MPKSSQKLTDRKSIFLLALGFVFLLAGLAAYLLAGLVRGFLESIGLSNGIRISPITEEALKIAGVGIVAFRLRSKIKPKNILWILAIGGLIVGLTFGFAETLFDEVYRENFFRRLLTSIPDHGLWTAIVAIGLYFPFTKYPNKWVGSLLLSNFYLIAVLWHAVWNSAILPQHLRYIALPILVMLVGLLIVRISNVLDKVKPIRIW